MQCYNWCKNVGFFWNFLRIWQNKTIKNLNFQKKYKRVLKIKKINDIVWKEIEILDGNLKIEFLYKKSYGLKLRKELCN